MSVYLGTVQYCKNTLFINYKRLACQNCGCIYSNRNCRSYTYWKGVRSGRLYDIVAGRKQAYYSALIGYIWYEATEDEKNFITLLDLINASEAREDDETYQSPARFL